MMQKNSNLMMQTMDTWILQIKDNPEFLKNMLGPMISDSQLREKMIQTMKKHDQMENYLKTNSQWMVSVHQPVTNPDIISDCLWCPNYQVNSISLPQVTISNSSKTMEIIHRVWINSEMSHDMHTLMLENPSHMHMMSKQMMEPMLNAIMDDEDLRQQMIELMLGHEEFMNTIRHDNPQTGH